MAKNVVFFDSNIWIYSFDKSNAQKYKTARELRSRAINQELTVVVSPQTYTESFRALTDLKLFAHPFSSIEAQRELYKIWQNVVRIYPNEETMQILFRLTKSYSTNIKRLLIYDAFLVATMLGNGIYVLYTDNEKDFHSFREIEIINPFKPREGE